MRFRGYPSVYGVIGVLLFAALAGCVGGGDHWRDNPLGQVDQSFAWDQFAWLGQGQDGDHRRVWESGTVDAAFGFTELLPSWNPGALHTDQGLRVWVSARDAESGVWSPWLSIGWWGSGFASVDDAVTEFEHGKVAVDILELDRPADAFRMRVLVEGKAADTSPQSVPLRRLTVVISGAAEGVSPQYVAAMTGSDRTLVGDKRWRRDLDVPFLPQKMLPEPLWSRGCSPTSVAMLLRYRGLEDCTPTRSAEAVYDARHDIYGNWNRAVAYAGSLGLRAELARFRTWDQLKAAIARGQPVIASIRFEEGEFLSNPMGSTDGHLIVIRGLTGSGDAIVNDPAFGDEGDGIIYNADELARAWLGKGGVAYLIGEPYR